MPVVNPGDYKNWPELPDQTARSGAAVKGYASIVLGLPFLAVGVFIGLVALDVVKVNPQRIHVPPAVVGAIAAFFAWAGLYLILHGIYGLRLNARVHFGKSQHPTERWRYDHPWTPHGINDDARRQVHSAWRFAIVMAVIMVPFNWWAWYNEHPPWLVQAGITLFDAVLAAMFARAIYMTIRRLKYGVSFLRFKQFPIRPGQPATILFENRNALATGGLLKTTLRCVQERYELRGVGKRKSYKVVCYERFATTQEVSVANHATRGDTAIELPIDIPADQPGTELSERPARFWELIVEAESPGVDFSATFLLPVYAQTGD